MSTKPQPGAGNPTAKQINDIVAGSQGGNPLPLICKATKLKLETVEEWLRQGREAKPGTALHTFAADYDAAAALAEINLRKYLADHAKASPEAAFRLLELQNKDKDAPRPKSQPLDNQIHEALAQAVSTGAKAGPAYQKITGCKPNVARAKASQILAKGNVWQRVKELQTASATKKCLTRERRLEVCHEVVESSTASHTDRLRAAKLDAELKGELIGKQDLTTNGESLPTVMPAIIINLPERFTRQRGTGKPE